MSLNVNPDISDVYYRYKMPKVTVKVEGKGNGIKTVITNITDIAKAIYRKPVYPIKYFGMELGSQTNVDEKNEKYIVNGAHEASKLQEVLYNFIKKYVLCAKCGNPETTLNIRKKNSTVVRKCRACGASDTLDVKHKLTQFIVKNPPETEAEGAAPAKVVEENEEIDENDNIDVNVTGEHKIDDMVEHAKDLTLGDDKKNASTDAAKTSQDNTDFFFESVTRMYREGTLLDERKSVRQLFNKLKLKDGCIMLIMEVVFPSSRTILADIEKYKQLFHLFTRIGPNREKFQQYIIGGILKLCEKFNLSKKAIHLVQAFYDHDIMEEDVIIEWHEKGPSKRYVSREMSKEILESCQPMIDWLKNAKEESASEEEEIDDNDNVSIDEDFSTPTVVPTYQSVQVLEEDETIDIDNI